VRGVDAFIDEPPQRGRRADRPEHVGAIGPPLAGPVHTVRAVGHRGGPIGEHITGA